MARVPTLFFDVGGVLLTNAWDTAARKRAAETFDLDYQEFQTRHEMLKTAFETGRISLDTYLRKTVFHRERSFKPEAFKDFTDKWLSQDRVESCAHEYQQVKNAFVKTILPHIDQELLKQVQSVRWVRPEDGAW